MGCGLCDLTGFAEGAFESVEGIGTLLFGLVRHESRTIFGEQIHDECGGADVFGDGRDAVEELRIEGINDKATVARVPTARAAVERSVITKA